MKHLNSIAKLCALTAACAPSLFAQLSIPSDGSDGPLNITSNTVIDLSQAVTGVWSNNNAANVGKGIYDASKWAVVFKYTSVNIAAGATVTFKNHASGAPVVWLVSTSVTNHGTINLDGSSLNSPNSPEGGPGGFRGGGRSSIPGNVTSGFGPGAGYSLLNGNNYAVFANVYGNPQIIPLVGGSGGGGYNVQSVGGGGGGAILIAASQTIAISGLIHANGGELAGTYGAGSGGAIRLLAHEVSGSGQVQALGANGGNRGRTRLQANVAGPTLGFTPAATLESPAPMLLWPETNAATVRVVSVSGLQTPADPRAALQNSPADVELATTNAVSIVVQTSNFPTNGIVNIFITPRNTTRTTYQAALISGSSSLATWQVQHALLPGYSVIQAHARVP
ncbi:MAG TPA: hypothetical protein VNT99_20495 [Methylomirabilota bacterium]|nr:hypothetical protein [Methylomirabilota bacterium]